MTKATQAERIAVVETKVDNIEHKVDGLHEKLDSFIDCADNKYAHKDRVDVIETKVNKHETRLAWYAGGLAVIIFVINLLSSLLW